MERILIVDGSNLLFQMFYGMPSRILGKNGRHIQGTLGFLGALRKVLAWEQPDYVFVAFDGEWENSRKILDTDYKANRLDYSEIPEEETPFSQMPDIFHGLEIMGIRWSETKSCEADDWIAGYAHTYRDLDMTIVSQDSDLFQLIGPHTRILRYRGEKTARCDAAYLAEKLGIRPDQYPLFKALTGDASDNIRGVDKVGPKTAAELVNQFADARALLSGTAAIRKPAIRKAVEENGERILKNLQLIRLEGREALPFVLEELKYKDRGFTTREILERMGL